MPLGFLAVFSEPGSQVTIDEFQDWYDNEHVPLRLNHLPSFLTGARYSAADSENPSWVALYDIDDTSTFQHESYTRLRANRSPREADLVKRLELLDRRTYEFLSDSGESTVTSSYRPENPTRVLLTHGLTITDADDTDALAERWSQGAIESLKKVDGWVRTRVYKCIDNLKSGTSVAQGPEAQAVPKYLVIHELLSPSVADETAFKSALQQDTTSPHDIVEVRKWALYRAYPSVAQGHVAGK